MMRKIPRKGVPQGSMTDRSCSASLRGKPGAATTAEPIGRAEMEWEEALLRAWAGERLALPAVYYRRNAARARQTAERVTTQDMKVLLLNEAGCCDRLALDADRVPGDSADL